MKRVLLFIFIFAAGSAITYANCASGEVVVVTSHP